MGNVFLEVNLIDLGILNLCGIHFTEFKCSRTPFLMKARSMLDESFRTAHLCCAIFPFLELQPHLQYWGKWDVQNKQEFFPQKCWNKHEVLPHCVRSHLGTLIMASFQGCGLGFSLGVIGPELFPFSISSLPQARAGPVLQQIHPLALPDFQARCHAQNAQVLNSLLFDAVTFLGNFNTIYQMNHDD